MAAPAELDEPVSVALIGRDDEARSQLRAALAALGADIVAEKEPAAVDGDALMAAAPSVVIVNLDEAIEDELDHLQALFDRPGVNVVFNEAATTRQLSGWDLARWARHLAVKVLGHGDPIPPAPEGREPLPSLSLVPGPGAPPTPADLAGERFIEEFTIEAEDHADQVPTDFMPMAEDAAVAAPDEHEGFELDDAGIASALEAADPGRPEVSSASVPDAASGDEDATLPDIDLSLLDAALSGGAQAPSGQDDAAEPASAAIDAPEAAASAGEGAGLEAAVPGMDHAEDAGDEGLAFDGSLDFADDAGLGIDDAPAAVAQPAPEPVDEAPGATPVDEADAGEAGADEAGAALLDETLAGFDVDAAPTGFSDFGDDDLELDLGADEDVAALAAQLDAMAPQDADDEPPPREPEPGLDALLEEPVAGDDAMQAPAAADEGAAGDAPARGPEAAGGFSLGSLELAPMDDDAAHAAPAGQAKPAADAAFDFDALGLSLEPIEEDVDESTAAVPHVVVLGASIGGPDALRTFLGGIPADFPALFLLAQHLESGFFERLAQQLQKSSRLPIRVAAAGQHVSAGEVLVVPSEIRLVVGRDGNIGRAEREEAPRYKPCIDEVLRDVADRFGKRATAIIFSGMAGDAVEGAVYLTSKGGEVWAQDAESCVVSSMVDGARSRGVVEFSGSPRELAERLVAKFG